MGILHDMPDSTEVEKTQWHIAKDLEREHLDYEECSLVCNGRCDEVATCNVASRWIVLDVC